MLSNFGPSEGRKVFENGPTWNYKWLKNGSNPWFSKNDPSPVVVPKRMNTAHFEPLSSTFQCVPHLLLNSPRRCSFPHQLGPNIQSWLGLALGLGFGVGVGVGVGLGLG